MPIQRIRRFLETEDLGIVHSLGIETKQLDRCVSEINRRAIRGVFGCPVFGFDEVNLDFLERLNAIVQVWFWEVALKDIDGLYSHSSLVYFGISPRRPAIDFSRFPKLHKAVWHPVRFDTGLGRLSELTRLDIWRYKPESRGLAELDLPASLNQIDFNWCNFEQLEGLMTLPNLEELQCHYCRNLTTLKGLSAIAPNLKKLVIIRCANLTDFEEALGLDLAHVYINVKGKELVRNDRNL